MLNRRNYNLVAYNPFRDMEDFEKRFFGYPTESNNSLVGGFRTDITDEGDSYRLEADLPGFKKEDIHVDVKEDMLTVSAERHSEHEDEDKRGKYLRCERSYGSYARSFDLSEINAVDIKAAYRDGVLTVTLPKKTPVTPESRRLEIE